MTRIKVDVIGEPAPQGSKRHVGNGRMIESSTKVAPWREAVKFAAYGAKPSVDDHFKLRGQCGICGVPGMDARHRVIDAISDRYYAGDSIEMLADDYDISEEAVTSTLYPLQGPLYLHAVFSFNRPANHFGTGKNATSLKASAPVYPHRKPDLDKLLRSTFDAITDAGLWRDDAQVVSVTAHKVYTDHPTSLGVPGASLCIGETA